jgi:hypothetical protein
MSLQRTVERDLYKGINVFKSGYQPKNNLVKDENGDLLADSHNPLNRWQKYLIQLLSVHCVSDVTQMEIPLTLALSSFQLLLQSLKMCKLPGGNKILA